MIDIKQAKSAQSRMESNRSNVDARRSEIAPLLLDEEGHFPTMSRMEGQYSNNRRFDSYPALALLDGVAGFEDFVMPKGQRWQKFRVPDEAVNNRRANRVWLEAMEGRLFALRNDPESGFVWNMHQSACSLFAFAMQSMWPDLRRDQRGRAVGLTYEAEHIDGIYLELDGAGRPYRIHRKIILSAQQAMDKWKDKSPKEVVDAMTGLNKNPDRDFTFVHCIEKNSQLLTGRLDAAGMPWLGGYYLEGGDDNMFATGGYETLPRIVSSFDRGLNQHYGKCPAMFVLPEIRACQVMKQDRVLAVEQKTKPPILAMDDALDRGVMNLGPYGVTYGGLDERGNPTMQPWLEGADLTDAAALHQEERDMIDRAFYRDLFQINKEYKTHITATRTMEEIAEKGIFLGPLARQEDEWLSRMLPRELWLMEQLGLMDDMPPELREYFAQEGGIDVMYDNNLSRMQEASGAVGLLRTAEMVTSLGSIDAEYVEAYKRAYDPNIIVGWLGRNNGIPAMLERSDDDKEAFDNDKAMAAQMQEALAAAPVIADAAKNFAQAESISVA